MGILMRHRNAIRVIVILMALVAAAAALNGGLHAQEVRLRRGDRLEMTVPQRAGLDRQLVVDSEGRVDIPVVGAIRVEGLLLQEAEDAVLRAVRETYPSVQRIVLALLAEESRRSIYVHGEVLNPGKYEFVKNPSVWEAVREAGGATPQAALQTVRIIRAEGEGRRTFLVDLQSVIENGNFESLPSLRPGDTVIIPERSVIYSGGGAVRVIGGVVTPGPYNLVGDRSLIDAVLAAGGPSDEADLTKVNIIRRMADGGQITLTLDFAKYLADGDVRHNPVIYPDDTVHIPVKRSAMTWALDPRFWLAAVTAFAAAYAVLR